MNRSANTNLHGFLSWLPSDGPTTDEIIKQLEPYGWTSDQILDMIELGRVTGNLHTVLSPEGARWFTEPYSTL